MPFQRNPSPLGWRAFFAVGFASVTSLSANPVKLSWTDNSDNESGFEIQRSTDGSIFKRIGIVAPNITNYSDATANPYTDYIYRVRAFNHFGRSGFTNKAERLGLELGEGELPPDESSNRLASWAPLQSLLSDPDRNRTALSTYDARDFDFTQYSIAGFTVNSESSAPILIRMVPSPTAFDRALSVWKTNANLEHVGGNEDWRSADQVVSISETIRKLGLTPPTPFEDPAIFMEPTPGQHMALLKGAQSLHAIGWHELIDTGSPESASNQLHNLYVISQVGSEQGGIATTFRVIDPAPKRFTLYAFTPQFATEQEQGALLEPQLNVYSTDRSLQYHSINDFVSLAEDTPMPLFTPASPESIAALQIFLPPGIYTAVAFSLSGMEEKGVLALSIQN